ncbi:hypothetical protein LSAT2_010057 [Lamellibrachia satsuma]|nr:hypothetical protein LSAT2_010057 [Lamellibrachia satsuma]
MNIFFETLQTALREHSALFWIDASFRINWTDLSAAYRVARKNGGCVMFHSLAAEFCTICSLFTSASVMPYNTAACSRQLVHECLRDAVQHCSLFMSASVMPYNTAACSRVPP